MAGPNVYQKDGKWYYSCCGDEIGPFDNKGQATTAAKLHMFSH